MDLWTICWIDSDGMDHWARFQFPEEVADCLDAISEDLYPNNPANLLDDNENVLIIYPDSCRDYTPLEFIKMWIEGENHEETETFSTL